MAEPLNGLRAIEFGQLLAGPFTGTLLGDFGADVIKIEAPGDGRRDARLGPPAPQRPLAVVVDPRPQQALASRSTCASPRASGSPPSWPRRADIVLENFRPGTMEKWGLGPEDVHARNPRCDLRARLRLRPDRPLRAPARVRLRGRGDLRPAPHQRLPGPGAAARRASRLGDTLAAQSAFQGILLALYARERGAEGQVVDAGIVDACFAMSESSTLEYEKTGFIREPTGPRLPRIAPSNVYLCSDGKWVVIAANHDTLWRRLATIMGQPELGEDERFATHHARGEHEDLLDEIIGAFAARHTAAGARRDRQRGRRRVRAGLHGEGRLRGPVLPRARAARGASRTRSTGT